MDDTTIWRKNSEDLTRYAAVIVGRDAAEDVLSAVVCRVLDRKGSLAALDEPRPYLFRAVLNEARNHHRARKRKPLGTTGIEWPPDLNPEVVGAVLTLPMRQRAAVYLTYWRDLSISEVADLMGCRSGTVKRYLHLARQRLKEVLNDA